MTYAELCTDGSLTSTFKLAITNKGLKLKLQNALQDTPLRILTSCHKRAIDAHYKSGFTVGEVVWRPFGDWEFPLTTNQMNRMFCFLPALHTIWLTPDPVKCATGVFQGEAYVAYLKNAFIAEYGMLSWMVVTELGIHLKVRAKAYVADQP